MLEKFAIPSLRLLDPGIYKYQIASFTSLVTMPRSGYDSTNYTNLQEAQRNHETAQASADTSKARARATNIQKPIAPPVSDPNSTSSSHSPPRTPIVPESTRVQLSSSPLLSTVVSSAINPPAPSVVPFQGHSTAIPSPVGSASTSTNPTPSSLSPSSTNPAVRADRELLPTVRISPGYVEHTGSYRLYNNSTGRGWRYSPLSGRSVNLISSSKLPYHVYSLVFSK